jgi:hypothetical protein
LFLTSHLKSSPLHGRISHFHVDIFHSMIDPDRTIFIQRCKSFNRCAPFTYTNLVFHFKILNNLCQP